VATHASSAADRFFDDVRARELLPLTWTFIAVYALIARPTLNSSGSANLSAQTLLAALLAAPLTWAARRRSRHKS
jgi:hypothetical protein